MTPRPGDVWTPRQDVEASGGARRVLPGLPLSIAPHVWFICASEDGPRWTLLTQWHAWVARHAATTDGVGDPFKDARQAAMDATVEAFNASPDDYVCRLRAAIGYETGVWLLERDAKALAARVGPTTPPRPARDVEALLRVAREALERLADQLAVITDDGTAIHSRKLALAALAALDTADPTL